MSELKPCPFCGEEPEIFDFNDGRFIVECTNPDCDVYPYTSIHRDRADAIAAWNQRATVYTKPTTLSQLKAENTRLWARVDAQNRDLEMHEHERSKLRELVRDMNKWLWNGADCTECPFTAECDLNAAFESDLHAHICIGWSEIHNRMRELGVVE